MKLQEKFRDALKEFSLVKKGDAVLVGVSGGPDSTALCFLFKEIQEKLSLRVTLAYLNHGLRKKESLREENFVKSLGERLEFSVIIERADVKKARGTSGLSLQEAARNIRYDFYARAAGKCGTEKVALAHHADDQAETMILRLMEGTGMEGLSGIHPKRGRNGIIVIRPLLLAAKKEILQYLKENKISYCVDSSNEKLVYKRNMVRKKILPALEKINPASREAMIRLWNIFYHENEWVKSLARKEEKKCVRYGQDDAVLSLKPFAPLPLPLKRRVLKNVLARVRGSAEDISFKHVESVRKWIYDGKEKLVLPGCIVVKKNDHVLIFIKGSRKKLSQKQADTENMGKIKLNIPGTKKLWNGFTVHAEVLPSYAVTAKMLKRNKNEACLDFSKATGKIFARRRMPGDRFIPYGMQCEIKLKDFYMKEKVKPELRGSLPVFENKNHIVWLPVGRVDERIKVDKDTENVLHLVLERT